MVKRILLLTLSGIAILPAQESTSAIPRNETALRNAIAGLGKKPLPLLPQRVSIAPPAPGACSVARKAMPIERPDSFTVRRLPSTNLAPMPQVAVPAPPCETTAS